jgi:hypothetical protein
MARNLGLTRHILRMHKLLNGVTLAVCDGLMMSCTTRSCRRRPAVAAKRHRSNDARAWTPTATRRRINHREHRRHPTSRRLTVLAQTHAHGPSESRHGAGAIERNKIMLRMGIRNASQPGDEPSYRVRLGIAHIALKREVFHVAPILPHP